MRGLVVVGGLLILAILLANVGSAETKATVEKLEPVEVTCTVNDGSLIVIKANQPITNLSIGNYCHREEVPKHWTALCHVSEKLSDVEVSFRVNNSDVRTRVTCS